jgi:hypothetical protein
MSGSGPFPHLDFGSRLLEWLTTGQLRVWSFFGNLDRYVIFSQEPVFFEFGFVTMSVMMVATPSWS